MTHILIPKCLGANFAPLDRFGAKQKSLVLFWLRLALQMPPFCKSNR